MTSIMYSRDKILTRSPKRVRLRKHSHGAWLYTLKQDS